MTLEALGWRPRREEEFVSHAADGLLPGRVVGEHRSHYRVATNATELTARTTGRLHNTAVLRSDLPGVGDFVALRLAQGNGPATIEAVLPRTSALIREAAGERRPQLLAANIDVVFIMTALGGDFSLPRIVRYLELVRESGATPVIVINKADLSNDLVETTGQIEGIAPAVPIHAISARAHDGARDLERYFQGNRTVALIGSSGVGKSTVTNQLLGRAAQATQEVRAYDGRGRHTTTHRQLFSRPQGGAIVDTPGLRGLEVWNAPEGSKDNFDDVQALATQCRFRDCRHDSEPACAVRAAIKRGDLDAGRFASYVKLARVPLRVAR
jgi:ribosome biogenesis GTPase / thiamine phosphate phosphatase